VALVPPLPRPISDTPEARAFCEQLVPGVSPLLVPLSVPTAAQIDDCFINVASVVEHNGGHMECGWMLWERPRVLLEAEFHAVWLGPNGTRLDVTPKALPWVKRIAFLPDAKIDYEGKQVDNRRMPLTDDPLVAEYIRAAEQYFEAINRGDLATFHGVLKLDGRQLALKNKMDDLEARMMEKYSS
jgi:hypothetical protein